MIGLTDADRAAHHVVALAFFIDDLRGASTRELRSVIARLELYAIDDTDLSPTARVLVETAIAFCRDELRERTEQDRSARR